MAPHSLGCKPVAPCKVAQMVCGRLAFSSAALYALCFTLCSWPSTQKRLPVEEALDSPLAGGGEGDSCGLPGSVCAACMGVGQRVFMKICCFSA